MLLLYTKTYMTSQNTSKRKLNIELFVEIGSSFEFLIVGHFSHNHTYFDDYSLR